MAAKRFRDAVGIDPDRVLSAAIDAALREPQSRDKKHHPGRFVAAGAAVAAAAAVGQRRMPRLAKVPLRMGLHKLGDMAHVDELADAVRDRLAGHEKEPDDYYDDEEPGDEELDGDEYVDEDESRPRDEAEDRPDDEDEDEGFDDEDDGGFEDDPEDGDGPRGEGDEEEPARDEGDEEDLEAGSEEEPPEDEEDLASEDDEASESEDDDDQIAARSLDLGVRGEGDGHRPRDRVPELFEALRQPARHASVMRRELLRVDPANRPPEPDQPRPRNRGRGRSNNRKSTAARA